MVRSPSCPPGRKTLPWFGFCFALAMYLVVATADDAPPTRAAKSPTRAVVIRFEGVIDSLSEHYLYRKLEEAKKLNADLIVIEIDSPGGEVGATLRIAERLRDLKWAKTAAYVPNEALSGAAIFSLGCDEIVIAPQAKFGDAGPVVNDQGGLFRHAEEKFVSHLARHVRDLAEAKRRPPALAEAMVDRNVEVFVTRHKQTGEVRFLSEHDRRALKDSDDWKPGELVHESRQGSFLEVNGQRAVELKLASANAASREELRQWLQVEGNWTVLQHGTLDTIVFALNNPYVTGLLIVIGVIGLFIEISSPGVAIGGLTSAGCFSLFFWSRFLGGTSGWLEVLLFFLGIICLSVEIFILPGFGVAGLTGLGLLAVSLLMASQDFVLPSSGEQVSRLSTTVTVLAISSVVAVAAIALLTRRMKSLPLFRRLVLEVPNADSATRPAAPVSEVAVPSPPTAPSVDSTVGTEGVADSPLRPAGKVRVGGRYLDVVTEGSFVDKGARVKIVAMQGNRVVVREIESE